MKQMYFTVLFGAVLACGAVSSYGSVPQLDPQQKKSTTLDRSRFKEAPVTQIPEGETKIYSRVAMTWVNDYGYTYGKETSDLASFFVFADNGEVFLKDPFSGFLCSSWLKGSVEGDEIVFPLPQVMYRQYDDDGNLQDYSANNMKYVAGDEGGHYEIDTEHQEFVFVMQEDGSIVQKVENKEDEVAMLGLCNPEGEWTGYGDFNYVFTPFSKTVLSVPDNLVSETYAMMYDNGDGHFCNVAFDGDVVYMNGIYPPAPGCIRGEMKDGKVVFPSGQYVGVESSVLRSAFVYLTGVKVETKLNEEYGYEEKIYTPLPEIEMVFDADRKVFTVADGIAMSTSSEQFVNMTVPYVAPEFKYQAPDVVPSNPEKPVFDYVEFNENVGIGSIWLSIPKTDVNGLLLDTKNMYYSLYVDGELFTFEPDEYASLSDPITEVPYLYNDGWDISGGNFLMHYIYYFFQGADTLEAVSIYKDAEGNRFVSERAVYSFAQGGISGIDEERQVVSSRYYDMTGRPVDSTCQGFVIRLDIYDDGTSGIFKQLHINK